jgi:hypothetical protein
VRASHVYWFSPSPCDMRTAGKVGKGKRVASAAGKPGGLAALVVPVISAEGALLGHVAYNSVLNAPWIVPDGADPGDGPHPITQGNNKRGALCLHGVRAACARNGRTRTAARVSECS